MKHRYKNLKFWHNTIGLLLFLTWSTGLWGQTTYDWLNNAPDGNWKQGAGGARWNPGGLWDEPGFGVLRFNNNHQLSMTNNVPGTYSQHSIIFGSFNTSNRTIGGNTVRFFDNGGTDPKIENQSTGSHTINFNIEGDGDTDPLEMNPTSGNLTFGGTVNNQGTDIFVFGNNGNTITYNGVISGTGKFIIKQNSKAVFNSSNTYTGNTELDAGELWIGTGGDISSSSSIFLGNGGALATVAKLWLSNASGGTTFIRNITVNNGNTTTRYIGGINTSGTHTFSGNITNNSSGGLYLSAELGGGTTAFSGVISGSNPVLTSGAGTVVISGSSANTYTGVTTIAATTILNKSANVIAIPSATTINNGITLRTDAANQWGTGSPPLVTINGNGVLNLNNNNQKIALASSSSTASVSLGSGTLNIDNTGSDTYAGGISGSGGVTKTNTGTLILSGANTYSGTTTISAGTLQLNRTGGTTIPNTNSVTVSGGTLRVSQNQTLSNLTLSSGGLTIDSGTTLTLTGNVTINNNFTITNNGTLVIEGTLTDNRATKSFGGTVRYEASSGSQTVVGGSYSNLELAGASAKTFNGDIAISGNFTVSGGIVTPPSMVTFNGSSAQNIAGLDYNNIEFSNGGANAKIFTSNASVSPTSAITFTGSPGTVDFDGASNNLEFVLQSTAAGTARVGNASDWNLNGRVRAERFVPAKRAWRLLTAPLKGNTNNSIFANWQGVSDEGVLLWGPNGTASPSSEVGNNGLFNGPQANIWSYGSTGWTAVSNTNSTPLLNSTTNNAFLVFAVGPHGGSNIAGNTSAVATTLKPKGQLITGDVDGNVTITGLTTNQFNLIANPFASPISTSALRTTNPNFTFWLLDPTLGSFGGYYTFNGTNWTPIAPNVNAGQPENLNIQSGQGFFVRSETETTFTFNESHKETGNSNTWFEKQSVQNTSENKIRVLLDRQINNQWQLVDGILSVSGSTYANELDAQDALKVTNFNENIQFRNGTTNLAIEYLNLPTMATEQPIRLMGTTSTSYRLRVRTEGFASLDVQPILQDTQSGTNHLIPTDGSTIEIPFTGVVSTTSTPDNRFKIVYQQVLGVEQPINNTLQVYPNPVTEDQFVIALPNSSEVATYEITNYLGQVVQKGNLTAGNTNVSIASQAVGVYLVRVQQNGLVYTTKIVKK